MYPLTPIFFSMFLPLLLYPVSANAEWPEMEREIADFDRQIQQNRELAFQKEKDRGPIDAEIIKNQAVIAELERRLAPVALGLEGFKLTSQKAKYLLDTAVSNPELVDSQKLETLHKDYRAALVNQSQKENEAALLNKELDGHRKQSDELKRKKRVLDLEIEVLNRGVRSLAIKKPVIVEAEGECVMHEDITAKACKEQAVLKAKQNAIETGGSSLVRSLTEVSMNDIVRDEISVKTLAKIRHLDVLQAPQLMAQGELGKYVTKIRAVVQSQPAETQATEQKPATSHQSYVASPPRELEEKPLPIFHIAMPGETLFRVSRMYGIPIDKLKKWNNLSDDFLEVGQRLIVGYDSTTSTRSGINQRGPTESSKVTPSDTREKTPTSAFNLAYNDFLNGRYGVAIAGFQRFTKDFPETSLTSNAHYWLGESFYYLKEYSLAIQSFEFVIMEYPGNEKIPAAMYKVGLATAGTGDLVKSRKYFNRVIEEFPASDEAKLAKNKLAEVR